MVLYCLTISLSAFLRNNQLTFLSVFNDEKSSTILLMGNMLFRFWLLQLCCMKRQKHLVKNEYINPKVVYVQIISKASIRLNLVINFFFNLIHFNLVVCFYTDIFHFHCFLRLILFLSLIML